MDLENLLRMARFYELLLLLLLLPILVVWDIDRRRFSKYGGLILIYVSLARLGGGLGAHILEAPILVVGRRA
eukprot:CAMPEP_0170484036 /NCGR_PEP_ID=MMETSP0208-20121228/3592_1 /TAXON_ID=197538 /ORGANISM="Strombidium inclinatum, Strain S3" /LENGTH=71 /DNA_ID=CAMNT_0010757277 /DNA_START=2066 /DNA_END=2277 /DNA_ORIENTATION=-